MSPKRGDLRRFPSYCVVPGYEIPPAFTDVSKPINVVGVGREVIAKVIDVFAESSQTSCQFRAEIIVDKELHAVAENISSNATADLMADSGSLIHD